ALAGIDPCASGEVAGRRRVRHQGAPRGRTGRGDLVTALVVAIVGAAGVHLLWSGLVLGHRSLLSGARVGPRSAASRRRDWLVQAGFTPDPSAARDLLILVLIAASSTGLVVFAVFGGVLPALVGAAFGASGPPT